jgi:hypothetical protein
MKFLLLLIAIAAVGLSYQTALGQAPASTAAAEFKQKLEQISVGNAATVKRKDGLVFSGAISELSDNSATIADRTLNVRVEIAYAEIIDVVAGAAGGRTWNGRAKVSHSRRNLAILVLAAGILIPVIVAVSGNGSHSPVFSPSP